MDEKQTKKCEKCGKEFIPKNSRQKYCSRECSGSPDNTSPYYHNASSLGYIRDVEAYARRRRKEVEARDHIIGEGYAERQIADTLSKVEKIKTEL